MEFTVLECGLDLVHRALQKPQDVTSKIRFYEAVTSAVLAISLWFSCMLEVTEKSLQGTEGDLLPNDIKKLKGTITWEGSYISPIRNN